jgi:hypothetical protein
MPKDNESEALDSLMEDSEKEDAKALFNPTPVTVQVIVNAGGGHAEPDGDEGEEGQAGALKKLTGGK